jgi:hypothetical protein
MNLIRITNIKESKLIIKVLDIVNKRNDFILFYMIYFTNF